MAALAVPKPPVKWYLRSRPDNPTADEERAKTTPDRFRTMCRAVAVAEWKYVLTPVRSEESSPRMVSG
jgi:hypothetical protein